MDKDYIIKKYISHLNGDIEQLVKFLYFIMLDDREMAFMGKAFQILKEKQKMITSAKTAKELKKVIKINKLINGETDE